MKKTELEYLLGLSDDRLEEEIERLDRKEREGIKTKSIGGGSGNV